MYNEYKKSRNKAWEVLLDCGIKSLPVDLGLIARRYNLKIVAYSKTTLFQVFNTAVKNGDGFIAKVDNQKEIFINDKINNRNRRRFTLAHELGHGLLEHNIGKIHYRNSEIDNQSNIQEFEANIFARDILMPTTVLAALNVHTVEEIMNLCDISRLSAEIRLKRLVELYKRNMFNIHPLEKQVRKQFSEFINTYQK
ncbi:MAG: ImmA/IrrE family metallo-endopeptidase [Clostridia bacterium]|jgi:Zn-dependent peptidase ImmA (M78 family)|nr:ImmA/IrrE family metallo-endopeptidase [Clostridia bacterium]MCI2014029.1 ImmA/IrrE family metallo-endopeptidase [Clostridia bacterium]